MSFFFFYDPNAARSRLIRLVTRSARPQATEADKQELRQLLKAHPDLEKDAKAISDELERFGDEAFFESCLKVLFKTCSASELNEFLETCRSDRKRWEEFHRLRDLLVRIGEASKEAGALKPEEQKISPESLKRIWNKFQTEKDKPPMLRRKNG